MKLLLLILVLSGCRGSGVPWRRFEATISKGARVEVGGKVSLTGTAELSVRVESGAEGTAQIVLDRAQETSR